MRLIWIAEPTGILLWFDCSISSHYKVIFGLSPNPFFIVPNVSAETCFKKYWKHTEKSTRNRRKIPQKNINEFEKKYLSYLFLLKFYFPLKNNFSQNTFSKIIKK